MCVYFVKAEKKIRNVSAEVYLFFLTFFFTRMWVSHLMIVRWGKEQRRWWMEMEKINRELFPGLQSVSVVWFSLSIDDTSVTSRTWGRIQCNNGDLRNAGFTGGVRKSIVLCIHYSHTKQHSVRAETCDGEAPWQTQCQQSECDNVPLKSCRLCRESHLWPCWSDEKGSQNVPLIFLRRNMINQTAKTGKLCPLPW